MGVAASGESKLQHVRVEILLAAGAKMLRVRHVNVNRSLRPRVPQIVEQAPYALVAVGTMATARTGPAFEVPAPREFPGLGKILNTRDPFGSIRSVFPRCSHFFLSRQVTSSRLKKSAIKGGYLRKNPVFMLQSLSINGNGVRDIARVLKTSPTTGIEELKKRISRAPCKPDFGEAAES